MESHAVQPIQAPTLNLPSSPNIVKVRIIDTTTSIRCKADYFLSPIVGGMSDLLCNAFAFLVENPRTGEKVIFDLGVRKDWENMAAPMVERLRQTFDIHVMKGVADILKDEDLNLEEINSIIWR